MHAKQLLEMMADIEARIAKVYERFATEFRNVSDIGDLWVSMGREELHHAEQLSLVTSTAPEALVPAVTVDHIATLEAAVAQFEREVAHPVQLQDALRVTVDLEQAEAEHLHGALNQLGDWAARLSQDPAMQHRKRHVLEHAVTLFGTSAVQERLSRQRFSD